MNELSAKGQGILNVVTALLDSLDEQDREPFYASLGTYAKGYIALKENPGSFPPTPTPIPPAQPSPPAIPAPRR